MRPAALLTALATLPRPPRCHPPRRGLPGAPPAVRSDPIRSDPDEDARELGARTGPSACSREKETVLPSPTSSESEEEEAETATGGGGRARGGGGRISRARRSRSSSARCSSSERFVSCSRSSPAAIRSNQKQSEAISSSERFVSCSRSSPAAQPHTHSGRGGHGGCGRSRREHSAVLDGQSCGSSRAGQAVRLCVRARPAVRARRCVRGGACEAVRAVGEGARAYALAFAAALH